ncbi:hypothetical protein [Stigmatella aurantiaca]|uniref:hypothetical protein n=1 Tax=Stigmatella aurantiaca TaxID=41 RepID=UPI00059F7229|nr:hypothetical protein [Stigmatella aurantiaca]
MHLIELAALLVLMAHPHNFFAKQNTFGTRAAESTPAVNWGCDESKISSESSPLLLSALQSRQGDVYAFDEGPLARSICGHTVK